MKYLEEYQQYLCSGTDAVSKGVEHFSELRRQFHINRIEKGMVLAYSNDMKGCRLLFQTLTGIDLDVITDRSLVYYVNGSVAKLELGKVITNNIPIFKFNMVRLPTQREFDTYNVIDTV